MPFMEEAATYEEWDVNQPYSAHPEPLLNRTVSSYMCPSRRTAATAIVPYQDDWEWTFSTCGCGRLTPIRLLGGASGDYAGNHGDPSPGATGADTDFYLGGNGTGVIISSRAQCQGNQPITWVDEVRVKHIEDGTSHTFLAGELHVTPDRLLTQPFNGPLYNGQDLAAFARIGGPGVPLARGQNDEPLPILGFGSWHAGVCNFVMVDGSVQAVNNLIDTTTLANLCHRADGAVR